MCVCVNRPGQGKSDPQRDRTFAGWAADLEAVANALGADQFAVHRLVRRRSLGARGTGKQKPSGANAKIVPSAFMGDDDRSELGLPINPDMINPDIMC